MLFGEQLGRRHQGDLVAVFEQAGRDGGSDRRLAGAHVALQQTLHRLAAGQVVIDFGDDAILRTSQDEAERGAQAGAQGAGADGRRAEAPPGQAQAAQTDLVGQQLLEHQAPLCGVARIGEQRDIRVGGRAMDEAQGGSEIGQCESGREVGGHEVRHRAVLEQREGLFGQPPQAHLVQTLGSRVDGCQRGRDRARLVRIDDLHLGMDHFERVRSAPRFAVAAHAAAGFEALLLRGIEMEEAQMQRAAPIADPAEQGATPAEHHLGGIDGPFHERFALRAQGPDWDQPGAILVAQRQVEEQVADACDAQAREAVGELGSDAREARHRILECYGTGHALTRSGVQAGRARIASISTAAPRGRAATPMAARAGYGAVK